MRNMAALNDFVIFRAHPFGENATGWIARFSGRMAALQLLAMERPLRVVAPCPAPGKPHTPTRSTELSRIICHAPMLFDENSTLNICVYKLKCL